MKAKTFTIIFGLLIISGMLLASCQPQEIITTQVVTEVVTQVVTQVVEKEGETIIETQVVEVVITPTPEPEPTAVAASVISPDFKDPDTLLVITGAGDQETLDPSWTYETRGSAIETNIYEGLVWFNRERTDQFVPMLATSWEVNDAGDVWTFNIREGVTFHEGGTLEPHDVAYSIHRGLLQDRIDGPHWMTLEAFFGLFAIQDLATEIGGVDSFDAVSDAALVETCERVKAAVVADDEAGTVTYTLNQPTPWFLAMMSNIFMGATYDQEWMVEQSAWDGSCDTWVQFHDPAAEDSILFNKANGTGPYKLDYWDPVNQETVLVANEDYWRTEPIWEGGPSGSARIKRALIKNVDEWGTRLAMLEAGDADYIYVPSQFRPQLEPYYKDVCFADESCQEGSAEGYIQVFRDLPQNAMTPAQFNWGISVEGGNPFVGSGELDGNGIPPDFFLDIHIRKAFNYCFDFDAMINDALNGEGQQAQGPIIAGMLGYREGEAPMYYFDLAKCEEEFKLADVDKDGVPGEVWENGFYMQMAYNTGNDTRRLASEILKAGIEAVNPNFNISVVGMPWPVLLNNRRAQKLPIYVGGWLEDFHDPHNWVHPFLHSQGTYGRVINMPEEKAAEFDALIEQAASLTTAEERLPIYEEIQLKAQEDAVVIWMYQAVGRTHLQEWVQDFYYNSGYSHQLYSYLYSWDKVAP